MAALYLHLSFVSPLAELLDQDGSQVNGKRNRAARLDGVVPDESLQPRRNQAGPLGDGLLDNPQLPLALRSC